MKNEKQEITYGEAMDILGKWFELFLMFQFGVFVGFLLTMVFDYISGRC